MYLLTTFQKPFEKPVKPPKSQYFVNAIVSVGKKSPDTNIGEVVQFIDTILTTHIVYSTLVL